MFAILTAEDIRIWKGDQLAQIIRLPAQAVLENAILSQDISARWFLSNCLTTPALLSFRPPYFLLLEIEAGKVLQEIISQD